MAEYVYGSASRETVIEALGTLSPHDERYLRCVGSPLPIGAGPAEIDAVLAAFSDAPRATIFTMKYGKRTLVVAGSLRNPAARVCTVHFAHAGIGFEPLPASVVRAAERRLVEILVPRMLEMEVAETSSAVTARFCATGWDVSARFPEDVRAFDTCFDRLLMTKRAGYEN